MDAEMNQKMESLLRREGIDLSELPQLNVPRLIELLNSGIHRHRELYVFNSNQPDREAIRRLGGTTGYEATENHIHMEDYIASYPDPVELLRVGLSYAKALFLRLKQQYPHTPFTVILGYSDGEHPSCVVRFVKHRKNDLWLGENLDNYRLEKVMRIKVNHSTMS